MSLFTDNEICWGCKHAVFYECDNCLDWCRVRAESQRDRCTGKCSKREEKEKPDDPE